MIISLLCGRMSVSIESFCVCLFVGDLRARNHPFLDVKGEGDGEGAEPAPDTGPEAGETSPFFSFDDVDVGVMRVVWAVDGESATLYDSGELRAWAWAWG